MPSLSTLKTLFLLATVPLTLVSGHSWLECAKYGDPTVDPVLDGKVYDINQCQGFPRAFQQTFGPKSGHVFGIDRGFNVQPGRAAQCNGRPLTYTTDYPQASYKLGEEVRLVWPAKNHDAEQCTNPFIPDTAMKIYVTHSNNGINGPSSLGTATSDPATSWKLVVDFKATQLNGFSPGKSAPEGFQRCPDFCGARGTDKAICFQDMIVPNDGSLVVGQTYTFLWYWIFNQGSPAYTTCWDVTITAGGGGGGNPTPSTTTGRPTQQGQTTPRPTTARPTTRPTPRPTTPQTVPTTVSGEQSLQIRVDNTAGTFDQAKMVNAISTQLNVQACKVVVNAFSGQQQNGQSTFFASLNVNVQASSVSVHIAQIGSANFQNAINAATGGSSQITVPTAAQQAVPDSCSSTGTTTSISRYTISMSVTVSNSAANQGSFAGTLATGIDDALNTVSITADVSCLASSTSGTFNCAVIVFTIEDVVAVSNLANGQSNQFTTLIATHIPASATNNEQLAAAALTVSNAPQNTASTSQSTNSAKRSSIGWMFVLVSALMSGLLAM